MALIRCPKCGKEMSDRAAVCPQCGTPIDEIKAALQEVTNNNATSSTIASQQSKKGKRLPVWAEALIIAGALLIIWFFVFKPSKNDIPQQSVENKQPHTIAQPAAPAQSADGGTAQY